MKTDTPTRYRQLLTAYREARREYDADTTDDHLATEEMLAWDALIDYVEAFDLNDTAHDPREHPELLG